ncbi:MAG TPA: crotonase/enoyl-CoA hydratase family protein [Acidimicrobiales bacterium]|nr:crotonase/enoyl-CoA hydratase family protein [Acidimicrobiales bacterium]
MNERVTVVIDRGVADVRLNRPDKLNALDTDMFVALVDAGARLAAEPSVRAVVLSGEGRAFSAGLDFSGFRAMADGGRAAGDGGAGGSDGARLGAIGATDGRITHLGQQAAHCWSEVPAPVIAAIWGHCLGGGLQIALGADLRIVHPDATLAVLEIRWGLSPDMTGTATLSRLVGPDVAKELAWTGRAVSGEEAVRLGLATRATDTPLDDALALARDIATKNPHAIRGIKRLLEQSGRVPLAQQYADEREVIGSIVGTPNQVEAVTAYFDEREPTFADPG